MQIKLRKHYVDFSNHPNNERNKYKINVYKKDCRKTEIKKSHDKHCNINTLAINVCNFYETQFSKEAKEHVANKEFILHYIVKDKAWRDATIGERFNNDSEIIKNKNQIICFLENELLNKTERICLDYNSWHNSICELSFFNMRYGIWQKLINMTFKYLYCVKDVFPEFSSVWEVCHCPIDTVIAKQIHSKLSEMNVAESELVLSKKISKSDSTINWNHISQKDYFALQKQISFICEKENIYPIEFDFLYWKK